ncbi:hypothetical protein [Saccharothrix luteola]|uniref:hypothetical protein n=1 Tax=Saccharothrix luteola TaxID=2893018 RepID=UPI001E350CA6|nr:hypothetical protein [Saccharothrix luteola]MCC8247643.1 hypothetical protein [Saccharothrix luteola]
MLGRSTTFDPVVAASPVDLLAAGCRCRGSAAAAASGLGLGARVVEVVLVVGLFDAAFTAVVRLVLDRLGCWCSGCVVVVDGYVVGGLGYVFRDGSATCRRSTSSAAVDTSVTSPWPP